MPPNARFPLQPVSFVLASTGHGSLIVNRNDYIELGHVRGGVGHQLLSTSYFDLPEIDLACELLGRCRGLRGDGVVAIDCGANVGAHTIEWARRMRGWGRVVAIEAQERLFYALAGNLALNNCDNARAIWAAAAAESGQLEIPTPDYEAPGSYGSLELRQSAASESIGQRLDPARNAKVPALRLDELGLERVDLIKIDVEGMELDVLAGAEQLIARDRPLLIVEAIKCDWAALRAWLDRLGYGYRPAGINIVAAAGTAALEAATAALQPFQAQQDAAREEELARQRAALAPFTFRFLDEAGAPRPLLFGAGEAGVCCLGRGWTPPAPVYGPWTLEQGAWLELPAALVPASAHALNISGLVFAPQVPPFEGRHRVRILIDGRPACDELVANESADRVCAHTFACVLAPDRAADQPLRIEFHCEHQRSLAELGIAFDTRPVAFALMRIELA